MTKDFNILVKKLESFRNKYYRYRIARGFIITFFLLLVLFLLLTGIESLFYLSSGIRTVLFHGFLIFFLLLIIHYIIIPLLRLFNVIRSLGIRESSVFIQDHFREIEDKLLNVIELSQIEDTTYSSDIVNASIDQKIKELSVFNFREAVQFRNLKVVFIYLIISVITTVSFFFVNRSSVTESIVRIVNYDTDFVKPAPFNYFLLNDELVATKGESFTISLECRGEEIPDFVYINIEGNNFMMSHTSDGNFEFEIASVINPVRFFFTDMKYNSDEFFLDLLPSPGITNMDIYVYAPSYTGIPDENYRNTGDLQVPAGSDIEWNIQGIDIDTLFLSFSDSTEIGSSYSDGIFSSKRNFYGSNDYNVFIKNDITEAELALSYSINTIPDLYPEIKLIQIRDSLKMTRYFFKGVIGDDYGFSGLKFHYNIENRDSSIDIPFIKSLTDQDFYFSYDFDSVAIPSAALTYYFAVTDNDIINNYKTTTSNSFVINFPDKKDIDLQEKEGYKSLERMLKESEELTRDIRNDLNKLRLKNMDTNVTDWEKKRMVNDIGKKQNKLERLYDKIREDNKKLKNFSNSFGQKSEEIREKQMEIEQLLDEVFTDELKKLLEEFNKLAEEFDNKKLNSLTQQMDLTYEDLQKQLDKNIEMLRRMKVEQKLQNIIDEINRIAGEEEKYSNDIYTKKNYDIIEKRVEEHKDELEGERNNLKEALDLNKELEKPVNFDDFDLEFEEINNSIEESLINIIGHKRKESGYSIKNNSRQLKNLAFSMKQMLEANQRKQQTENIENLRQILSNLIYMSFSQEDILSSLNNIRFEDPVLTALNVEQLRIREQSEIVSDSLYALAKRTPQINSMINNELLSINLNLDKACRQMEEGLFPNAKSSQQYIITSTNNLALMLNEALENLEKQLANAEPGDQQCEKPGGKKQGMNFLKKSSENIRRQLEEMIEQMKKGGSKPGKDQLGQMLMRHEMMQQMLREIMNDGNIGSSAQKALQNIDKMLEHNRKQLLNRNINAEMIARQNEITARLLEAEKSELERDFEKERESKVADDFYSNPVEFFEYKKEKDVIIENFNRDSHRLTNFYNRKYKQYLKNIENK